MKQKLRKTAIEVLASILKPLHGACVEAFYIYQSLMQAGWYEAFDHTQQVNQDSAGCPVKRLMSNQNNLLTNKDVIA